MTVAAVPIGSIAQWVTLVALIASAWVIVRGTRATSGDQVLHIVEHRNEVLTRALEERNNELSTAYEKIGELEASRSLQPIIETVVAELQDHRERMDSRWLDHEQRDQERHDAQMAEHRKQLPILQMIADTFAQQGYKNGGTE